MWTALLYTPTCIEDKITVCALIETNQRQCVLFHSVKLSTHFVIEAFFPELCQRSELILR